MFFSRKASSGSCRLLTVAAALCGLILSAPSLHAEGVFIPAPSRVDVVFDDLRGVLYITEGDHLLRYEVASRSFLDPLILGGALAGMDISLDGETLAIADKSFANGNLGLYLMSLSTLSSKRIEFPQASYEGGSYMTAFGNDGSLLISSECQCNGQVPLRHYVPSTGATNILGSVAGSTALRANADRSVIGVADVGDSSGPFGRYRVSDGNYRHETGQKGTGNYNIDIAVNPLATQYVIPSGSAGAAFAASSLIVQPTVIGTFDGARPVGVAIDPRGNRTYFPWATTPYVYVYDSTTLKPTRYYDFESPFGTFGTTFYSFIEGRAKTSKDGSLLFVTVGGGVRFVSVDAVAPGSPTAVAGIGQVTLSWSPSPNATSYLVYQASSAGGESAVPVLSGITDTTATIRGLTNGSTYFFTVAAITSAGLSTPTTEVSATPVTPPSPVMGLVATSGNRVVDLFWSAASGATSYSIYQGTAPGSEKLVASGVLGTTFETRSVANGTTYYFKVAGVNASGSGISSTEVTATPLVSVAAAPVLSRTGGTYYTEQIVTLTDATPGASIFYTTDGSLPTKDSARYSTALYFANTVALKAVALADGYANSPVTSAMYTIVPAYYSNALSVEISDAYDVDGIVKEGDSAANGGLDHHGNSAPAAVVGSSVTWDGLVFTIGTAPGANVASNTTIALPGGRYFRLNLLASGVNGNQPNQAFVVNYTDNTSTLVTQSLSDWRTPQNYAGEFEAASLPYRINAAGSRDVRSFFLYGYSFLIDGTKTVKSVTLPANRNVVVFALNLSSPLTPVSFSAFMSGGLAANVFGISDGTNAVTHGGIDTHGNALDARLLGTSQTWDGTQFSIASPNGGSAASGDLISLPGGNFAVLKLLAIGVNGNQQNQTFKLTYTDGTSQLFTRSLSDWHTPQGYAGESVAVAMESRLTASGATQSGAYNLYGYSVPIDLTKTVESLTLPKNRKVVVVAVTLTPST